MAAKVPGACMLLDRWTKIGGDNEDDAHKLGHVRLKRFHIEHQNQNANRMINNSMISTEPNLRT